MIKTCLNNLAIKNGYTLAAFNNAEMGNRCEKVKNIVNETISLIEIELSDEN